MSFIKKKYKKIGEELERQLKEELEAQGHVATGRLKNSIKFAVQRDGRELVIKALPRWESVNDGQPVGTNVSGSKIKRWLSAKGVDWKSDKSIVWKIKTKIRKEGTPTAGSFAYSKNGRRTGFVDLVFKRNRIRIEKEMKSGIKLEFIDKVSKAIKKAVSSSKNLKRK
jgi:hypothetical protein